MREIVASDGLRPVGVVQFSGAPKFYLLTGKFGSKAAIVGRHHTAVFGGPENPGGCLRAKGRPRKPLEMPWANGEKDNKKCLPGFSDGTWDRLLG